MAQVRQFLLPDVGEGLTEGEVLQWLVAVGDAVAVNQPLVEIETAKAAVELPSPYAGTVTELHAQPGDVVPVGSPLVSLSLTTPADQAVPEATAPDATPTPTRTTTPSATAARAETEGQQSPAEEGSGPVLVGYGVTHAATKRRPRVAPASPHGTQRPEAGPPGEAAKPVRHGGLELGREVERRFADYLPAAPVRAKPPVRRLAKELGVDLSQVRATGHDGVVTRQDVESAAALLGGPTGWTARAPQRAAPDATGIEGRGHEEWREDVRGVTRHMVEAMERSAFTIPHVTEWLEVDVTRSSELLERLRRAPAFDGVRVTPMLLVARAVLASLRRTPVLNARYDGDVGQIVHRGVVNLGFAAATPRGLVVPSVKQADTLTLVDLARALADLTAKAKAGRSTPADLTGGTFSITNVGALGVDGGTPLINPGESAILAVGAWREKPWVHRGALVVRSVCTLSLSFDHRIIDGATGSRFLVDVASLLEEPASDLAWV